MVEITKLRATEAAHYLRIAASTLAKLRCYGGGPRYSRAGQRIIVYDRADLDAWLRGRAYNSTSEYDALETTRQA